MPDDKITVWRKGKRRRYSPERFAQHRSWSCEHAGETVQGLDGRPKVVSHEDCEWDLESDLPWENNKPLGFCPCDCHRRPPAALRGDPREAGQ
jgi:hypothetical protein